MNEKWRKAGSKVGLWTFVGLSGVMLLAQEAPGPEQAPPPQFDTNAEVKVVRAPEINLSPELAEVVRLSQSGTDDAVVIAYVQNAPRWRITGDEIIYLQDLGVSDAVLKALASHSQTVPNAPIADPASSAPPAPAATPAPVAPPAPEPPVVTPPSAPPATVTEFYEPLAPYGTWVSVAPYGWCWQPSVVVINSGWRPYCDNGRWLWSDSGWYWHSYYSWGWAPFHYGRWFYHPHSRWVWLPDRTWGPSWVSWRYRSDYCGWAPLPPGAHFSVSLGWSYGGHRVHSDFGFGLAASHFTFVQTAHFADRRIATRALPRREANVVYNNTTVINNYAGGGNTQVINRGVDRSRIEAATRTKIQEVTVRELPRNPQRAAMPDRITKAGNADVVYRPGSRIELPRQVPTAMGRRATTPEHSPRESLNRVVQPDSPGPQRTLPRIQNQPAPAAPAPARRETPRSVTPTPAPPAPPAPPAGTPAPVEPKPTLPAPARTPPTREQPQPAPSTAPAPSTRPPSPAPPARAEPPRAVPSVPAQPRVAPAPPTPRVTPPSVPSTRNVPPPRGIPVRPHLPPRQEEHRAHAMPRA